MCCKQVKNTKSGHCQPCLTKSGHCQPCLTKGGYCQPCLTKSGNMCCKTSEEYKEWDIVNHVSQRVDIVNHVSQRLVICCKQVKNTNTFCNRITKREFKIFHQMTCQTKFGNYLLECIKCNNKPYVGKFETNGNHRINTHMSDSKKHDSIEVDIHFGQPGHDFTTHARFTFIGKITKPNLTRTEMTNLLLRREDFWIIKLHSHQPNGFNKEHSLKYADHQINAISNA